MLNPFVPYRILTISLDQHEVIDGLLVIFYNQQQIIRLQKIKLRLKITRKEQVIFAVGIFIQVQIGYLCNQYSMF